MVVKLEAVPQFASCDGMIPAKEVLCNWTVNGSEFSGMPTYRIPSFQYSANDVIPIRLTTSYKDPKTEKMFTAEASTQLTVSLSFSLKNSNTVCCRAADFDNRCCEKNSSG